MNLRLQSPAAVFVHTYDATVTDPAGRYRPRLRVSGEHALATLTIGPGANGRLYTRHIDGKHWDGDGPEGLYLNWDSRQPVHIGSLGAPADLDVSGAIQWGGDHSDQNYARLGRVLVCWGGGNFSNGTGQQDFTIGFPAGQRFFGTPAVTVQLDDTGRGTDRPRASMGAFPIVDKNTLICGSFLMHHKSDTGSGGFLYYTWFAIGRAA
jgi:hypothetical protein